MPELVYHFRDGQEKSIVIEQFPILFGRQPDYWSTMEQDPLEDLVVHILGKDPLPVRIWQGTPLIDRWAPQPTLEKAAMILNAYDARRGELTIHNCDEQTSRVHFMLQRENGRTEIMDLGSLQGTIINEQRIPSGLWVPLQHNDRIVAGKNPEWMTYRNRADLEGKLFAYIVVDPTDDLSFFSHYVLGEFKPELEMRGFQVTVHHTNVTTEMVEGTFREMKKKVPEDGYFIFYYSGHGRKSGLWLNDSRPLGSWDFCYDLSKLWPEIKAKQLYLIDACHSGTFLGRNNKPERVHLITSVESPEDLSYGQFLGQAFVYMLRRSPYAFRIDDDFIRSLKQEVEDNAKMCNRRLKPGYDPANTTFTMHSRVGYRP